MQPTIVSYVVTHSPKMIFIGFKMVGLFFLSISFLGPVPPAFFDILLVEVSMIGAQSSFSVKELLIFFSQSWLLVFQSLSSENHPQGHFLKFSRFHLKLSQNWIIFFRWCRQQPWEILLTPIWIQVELYHAAADKNHRAILCRKISSSDTSAIQERCW